MPTFFPDKVFCDCYSKACLDLKCPYFSNHFLPVYQNSKLSYLMTNTNRNNFTKSNHCYYTHRSSRSEVFLKKRLFRSCFPANFEKFLRTTFFTEHLRWLRLHKIFKKDECNWFEKMLLLVWVAHRTKTFFCITNNQLHVIGLFLYPPENIRKRLIF